MCLDNWQGTFYAILLNMSYCLTIFLGCKLTLLGNTFTELIFAILERGRRLQLQIQYWRGMEHEYLVVSEYVLANTFITLLYTPILVLPSFYVCTYLLLY